ncbi:alternative oxidase, mitochondrial-like [Branchiostoma floridae]|uniref:Alternative oxidase, mitochondrial-like n=1 Tax=Branchiostoma floridae TaxID=7739 RepID=A0A9J7MFF4_BRAFL|nr:alternative oxidase, mitochondrial-like [Branchiostoma floridae]
MATRGALRLRTAAVGGMLSRRSFHLSAAPLNSCLLGPRERQISLVQRMYLSSATQTSPKPVTEKKVEKVTVVSTPAQKDEIQMKDARGTTVPLDVLSSVPDHHRPDLAHFRTGLSKPDDLEKKHVKDDGTMGQYSLPHPIWTEEEVNKVVITHTPPQSFTDKLAYGSVKFMRWNFDLFSGFKYGKRTERKWLQRIIFLETVAGVPGMVAAMTRHLHSLRRLKRDYGWIHTLLEEAENERMHLMTALQLRNPSALFRWCVVFAQGTFVTLFSAAYLVSPRFCHRFVGYLEEEAVKTYTKCLEDFDSGRLPLWSDMEAPPLAKRYWSLPHDAMMRDVILAIRADEAHHRLVNHTLSDLDKDDPNPFQPGK